MAGQYNSEVVVISKDLTNIRTMKILQEGLSSQVPLTNPLLNPGSHCPGGYAN